MSGLADIALAFATECLGWDATFGAGYVTQKSGIKFGGGSFSPTDLNAVMKHVNDFGGCFDLDFSLRKHSSIESEPFRACVWGGGMRWDRCSADPCLALMEACVAAARKMREAA